MSKLVELPITVYHEGEVPGITELYESMVVIDLADIRWIHRTDEGEVYAVDFSGNPLEFHVEYEEFKKLWANGRRITSVERMYAESDSF